MDQLRYDCLSPARRELLAKLLEEQARLDSPSVDHIPSRGLREAEVSSSQKRLWFLQSLNPASAAYNVPLAVRLRGQLNPLALEQSWEDVVRRHDALRTKFTQSDDRILQTICSEVPYRWQWIDLTHLAVNEREAVAQRLMTRQSERPFKLDVLPQFQVLLLRMASDDHLLLINLHHIVCDAWSIKVIVRELSAIYPELAAGRQASYAAPSVQYIDFSQWQQERMRSDAAASQLEYWRERLEGLPDLQLPADFSPARTEEGRGETCVRELSSQLTDSLREFSREESVTLFITLLASFQLLLARYSGQQEFAVGIPVANRNRTEIENLVGFFANTLVLRSRLSGKLTFRELIRIVRDECQGAMANQELSLEQLIEAIRPQRQAGRQPLFRVMFVMQNTVREELQLPEISVERVKVKTSTTRFDLMGEVVERAGRLSISLQYACDLFADATVGRMLRHWAFLLEELTADPDRRVEQAASLPPGDLKEIVGDWNETQVQYDAIEGLEAAFERQVRQQPDAIAVVLEHQHLTYRQLNCRANRLARHLRCVGIAPGVVVALDVQRSPELLICILAVLKAGGVYLPLNAANPPGRQAEIVTSCASVLVIGTHREDTTPVEGITSVSLLDAAAWKDQSDANLNLSTNPAHPAYLIHTSGSTGKPKGAAVTRQGLLNLLNWFISEFCIGSSDTSLVMTAHTFDLTQKNLLAPLLVGGRLCLSQEGFFDPAVVARDMQRTQATLINCTPSAFYPLVERSADDACTRSLRCVFLGGEAINPTRLERWFRATCDATELVNTYGPTECTDVVSFHRVRDPSQLDGDSIPIGRPIGNTQLYVLDSSLNPVPVGVKGELYIGGVCLGRGYVNDVVLTADRFVPDPFGRAGQRLYRTGDICRFTPAGAIEYFGRSDNQVKVRGFRIELGEIAARLRDHEAVVEAEVVPRTFGDDVQLVAYVIASQEISPADLRRHVSAALPDYMVPAAFVSLDAFPLTSSGKLDSRSLPTPDIARPDLETPYVAPRNPIETQLAEIWNEVLATDRIGVHDNFFALGGHSLLATRVVSRILVALQTELPLARLFECPTIGELADEIATLRKGGLSPCGAALQRIERHTTEPLPVSFAQQRLWFLEQLEGELTAYNIPAAWRLRGTLDTDALRKALQVIVHRHEPLRTTFSVVDGEPVQLISSGDGLELLVEDLDALPEQQREAELLLRYRREVERPFDLSQDAMLRATLLRLGEREHVLLVTMHHIASDGWSAQVFLRELGALYDAHCRGAEGHLPELPIRYADYAAWQRKELQGERLEGLVQYWRRQLDGVSDLELPTDRPRLPKPSYSGARQTFTLARDLTKQLTAVSQSEGVTLHMTLLAAFQTLLARYSGQDDIAVGVPTAGRSHADLEDLIGFFINTVVVRTDLAGSPTFRELLRRVRQVSLEAYDHQELPFEKLVEELQPERQLNRSPLFQVLFQFVEFSDNTPKLLGLDTSSLPSTGQRVRFDLEMHLWEQSGQIRGRILYSTALFDQTTIERMAGHFECLLEGIASEADRAIGELPLLTEPERRELLGPWNDTAAAYPHERSVHQLFEEQAERTPDAVALVFENQQLTYHELNTRSNQLAHHLRDSGVAAATRVGIFLERSPDLIVAILGILKAGCAYVPLGANDPRQRVQFIVEDAGLRLIVSQKDLVDRLPAERCEVVCWDGNEASRPQQRMTNPRASGNADHVAYVMYTSGSTGRPKGVAVAHRSLTNLLSAMQPVLRVGPGVRMLGMAAATFDISVAELFLPLIAGGTTIVVSHKTLLDSRQLGTSISTLQPDIVQATPAHWSSLLDSGWAGLPGAQLVTTGEALPQSVASRLLEAGGTVWDYYGPTECTIWSTIRRVTPNDLSASIGRPIANTQVYVLDSNLQPLPIGVSGELYIGGDGLALGYLNRPDLTAERFVSDPFSTASDARLYRTGDACRWRADGTLEFLGRLDHQVKLRGFRIELGEIESALDEHPLVKQSIVLLREDRPDMKRLVAYCLCAEDNTPQPATSDLSGERQQMVQPAELARELRAKLPEYMLPAAFVMLDRLPLTASGKVDRRALPAPDDSRLDLETYVAPSNPIEEQLAAIWCELLGIGRVGRHDDFFALGGHSLLLVRLTSRIAERFGTSVPLASIFESATLQQLATIIGAQGESRKTELAERNGKLPSLVCLNYGPGLAAVLGEAYPVSALHLEGDQVSRMSNLEAIAEHAIAQLRVSQPRGPYLLCGYCGMGAVAFEMAQQLRRQGEEIALLVLVGITPVPTERRPSRGRLVRRISRHIRELAQLRPSQWASYLGRRIKPWGAKLKANMPGITKTSQLNWVYVNRVAVGYDPQPYPGEIVFFVDSNTSELPDPTLGWRQLARGGASTHTVSGSHVTMVDRKNLATLGPKLKEILGTLRIGFEKG